MAIIKPIQAAVGQLEISDNFEWFIDGNIGYQPEDNSTVITPISIKDKATGETFHVWHTRSLASSSFSLAAHLTWLRGQAWALKGIEKTFDL